MFYSSITRPSIAYRYKLYTNFVSSFKENTFKFYSMWEGSSFVCPCPTARADRQRTENRAAYAMDDRECTQACSDDGSLCSGCSAHDSDIY